MSLLVVGSIAFDSVKTPFGERERMLGGAAVHFSLAASFFTDVRVVGPVGDDFGDDEYAVLHGRGVNTDDVEHVRGRPDLLLARPLRVRHGDGPHRRHPAGGLRRVRAEAVRGVQGRRQPLPREHPARRPARGARAVHRRALRRAGLDEPLDRDHPRLAGADDRRRGPGVPQRRRDPDAHRAAQPRARRAGDHGHGAQRGGGQAGRVRRRPVHRRAASSRCPPSRWRP